jgi:hydrogenase nickel incorporation protein HypB
MCKGHNHNHSHAIETVSSGVMETHEISMEQNVMQANDDLAENNRSVLDQHGITAFDFMGAIGSGKTTMIGKIAERLKDRYGIAIMNGDATTVDDFDESAIGNTQMLQISTNGECHLDAHMVANAISKIDLHETDLMFIENVGNLVCPADFPLGSKSRVVVVSVSEGPYTVRKHTHMFRNADIAVINKMELAKVMDIDADALVNDIHTVNPEAHVLKTSCRTGEGLDECINILLAAADLHGLKRIKE